MRFTALSFFCVRTNRTRDGKTDPYYFSTPMLKGRLVELLTEMNIRPVRKSDNFTDLVEWTIRELPALAPSDPRAHEALAIVRVWWDDQRG